MPKISIIYHIYKNVKNLKTSLNSILQLDNLDDLELILINDNASEDVIEIVNNSKILNLKNIKYVHLSQNLGHSYCYNLAIDLCKTDYLFFCGSETKLQNDFINKVVKNIDSNKDTDILIFRNNYERYFSIQSSLEEKEIEVFTQLKPELVYEMEWNLSNKVFHKDFLIKNKIKFIEFHSYLALFILTTLSKFKKIVYVNESIAKFTIDLKPSHNLYDYLFQTQEFYSVEKKLNTSNLKIKKALEFWTTKICLYDFINYVINSDMNDKEKELAIIAAYKLNLKLYNNFFTNEYFKLIKEKKWKEYFTMFKPKLVWIQKEFNTK
ncbi:glycosyltransferase family 2 protein [Mycoplasmoides pirum]|uniref:glycosyltransferase family 2 protein n=1 Tax=Mycoplasmoides pirum TaxID=2122 RepID=UPI00048954BB|nr:glycosyltransferase family A protein [Mycoplasmoides pirum]